MIGGAIVQSSAGNVDTMPSTLEGCTSGTDGVCIRPSMEEGVDEGTMEEECDNQQ